MRIGLDFDNTLGDFVGLIHRITFERTGFEMTGLRERHPEAKNLREIIDAAVGKERFEAFMTEIHETELTVDMLPQPGAVEVARRLAARHELVVVTARNEQECLAVHRWLERHRIPFTGVIATARESTAPHAIEHGLAVHLDDTAEVLEAFDEAHPTVPALLALPRNEKATRAAHWRSVEHWLAFEQLVDTLEREQ